VAEEKKEETKRQQNEFDAHIDARMKQAASCNDLVSLEFFARIIEAASIGLFDRIDSPERRNPIRTSGFLNKETKRKNQYHSGAEKTTSDDRQESRKSVSKGQNTSYERRQRQTVNADVEKGEPTLWKRSDVRSDLTLLAHAHANPKKAERIGFGLTDEPFKPFLKALQRDNEYPNKTEPLWTNWK
jgi:hypothetical protein